MFLSINQQIIYLSLGLSVCLSIYLSICTLENLAILRDFFIFQVDNIKNAALLRDFLIFWSWLHQTENTSARPPPFFKLTTSKTKQFCETSFIFELNNVKKEAILRDFFIFTLDNIKNERILRDSLQKWKVDCSADGLVPIRFAIFPFHVSKVLRLPRKSDARSYEVLHLSRKIILANLQMWCSKMQPLSGNQRPDLLTSLMNMSFVLHLPRKMHLCRSSSNVPCLPSFLEMLQTLTFCSRLTRCTIPCACHTKQDLNVQKWSEPLVIFCTFWLRNVLRATTACTFSSFPTSQLPKVVRIWCALCILTSKCASRRNGVHFFDIATSKSGPNLVCFVHSDFDMCFAPQRRALFRHLNFQKWSENGVLCTFWLWNVPRATTACTFSTSQLPRVVRAWCVLHILTWKCASRHNGVHFFIAHLARWLRTRRFSEPTFRPSGATNHWKNTVFRDFPTFSRICIFFLLTLSLLWSALFYSSLLSASAHLCFSSVHLVGSLTSKLPSIPMDVFPRYPHVRCWKITWNFRWVCWVSCRLQGSSDAAEDGRNTAEPGARPGADGWGTRSQVISMIPSISYNMEKNIYIYYVFS